MKIQEEQDKKYGGGFKQKLDRPEWNKRHHLASWDNHEKPVDQRAYFSRPQSVPELTRFYHTHRSFSSHAARMRRPEARRRRMVLSSDTKENPVPERDVVLDGTMSSPHTGEMVPWLDAWQAPAWAKAAERVSPGTLFYRTGGIEAAKRLFPDGGF